jgi:hypothetical protein
VSGELESAPSDALEIKPASSEATEFQRAPMPGSPSEPCYPSSLATDNGLIERKPLDLLSGPGGGEVCE